MIQRLAAAQIGATFNQYAGSALLCERLAGYLFDEDISVPLESDLVAVRR